MKYQILFLGTIRKNVSACCLLKLPREYWVNLSAEDILKYFFIIFSRKQVSKFHANASNGDNLQNQVLTFHANVSRTLLTLVNSQLVCKTLLTRIGLHNLILKKNLCLGQNPFVKFILQKQHQNHMISSVHLLLYHHVVLTSECYS